MVTSYLRVCVYWYIDGTPVATCLMVPLLESALTVHTEGIINQLLLKVNGENYEGQYSHWTHHIGSRHTPGRLLLLCLSYLDFSVIYIFLRRRGCKVEKLLIRSLSGFNQCCSYILMIIKRGSKPIFFLLWITPQINQISDILFY